EAPAPPRPPLALRPAVPPPTSAPPRLPPGRPGPHLIDDARHFVPRNARILNPGPEAFFCQHVAVADTASLHLDAHLPWTGLGNLALDDLEIASRLRNLRDFHWCYCDSCRCHDCLL